MSVTGIGSEQMKKEEGSETLGATFRHSLQRHEGLLPAKPPNISWGLIFPFALDRDVPRTAPAAASGA
ncbi:MAG: hypothetical protein MZV70_33535 [Desulfobacterales bacterium]|nr:hypothetical protein [Desulfobacterales bacterium]